MRFYLKKFLLIITLTINISKIYGMENEEIIDLTSLISLSSPDMIEFMDSHTFSTVSYEMSEEEEINEEKNEEYQEEFSKEFEEFKKHKTSFSFGYLLPENLKHIGSFLDWKDYINFKFINVECYITLLGEFREFTVHSLIGQNFQEGGILINETVQKIIKFFPKIYALNIQPEIGEAASLPLTKFHHLNSLSCTLNAIHANHQFFKELRQCKQLRSLKLKFGQLVRRKSLWEESIVPALQALNLTSLYLKFTNTLDYAVNTSIFTPLQLSRLENLHLKNIGPGTLNIALQLAVLPPVYMVLSNLIRLAPNLKTLSIPANEIGTFNNEGLVCLFESVPKSLTFLDLSNNALTNEFLHSLPSLLYYVPNLRELDLSQNQELTKESVREFQENFPNLKFIRTNL